MPKVARSRTRCRCSTASPIPSRCRKRARERSKAISTSSCLRSRDSSGKTTDGGIDCARKDDFNFISCIRLPDFVTREDFDWAVSEAAAKKKLDLSAVELLRVDEGLCVQRMHTGPYDGEPATINAMRTFVAEQGYALDFSESRLHHEIYLSDPRKCAPEKLKTVIRHPIKLI